MWNNTIQGINKKSWPHHIEGLWGCDLLTWQYRELPEEEPPREGRQLFFGWAKTVKDLSEPKKAPVGYADTTDTWHLCDTSQRVTNLGEGEPPDGVVKAAPL
jgi:hypothetical protein